ncbi:hypothetical protein O181_017665 [Austropuccinia psidii MF-1]|uniref:Uncharacterized protein n=1 Tax=Austropuccinia psidii MF-1 TaxID=1389203 RepID=A0A9Q3C773_9BASI|nr:hypothetical protein [Austropuccinia psidii MF-1]
MASTACGPWDSIGPFWPNSNEAKRAKGGILEAPNAKWAHLSLFWPYIPEDPKNPTLAQRPKPPKMAMASGNHQRPPAFFKKGFPLKIREIIGPAQWTQVCGNQQWCIYGIIYHYAPFFLGDSMEMLLRLHYEILNQVPKQITHFEGRLYPLSLTIHGSSQKTI